MNVLDMKTVIFSYLISNAISATVIFSMWRQNRRRFAGLGFWLADFVLQFISLCLVILRGRVPDLVSMTVSNSLIIGGTILIYMGLVRFIGKRSTQTLNIVLLAVFIPVHSYFVIVHPSLEARNILFSLGLLVTCFQCVWLMLRTTDPDMRSITRGVGMVFVSYCLVSLVRIPVDLTTPLNNDFFNSNLYDTVVVVIYQMLSIILTFYLFLMVNRRLVADLEHDIAERKRVEDELRLSEEKFFKAFHSSPDAVTITRMSDGQLVEVNEGFSRLTGYSREEALVNSSINLGIWANPQDREVCIAALRQNHGIRDYEYDFRIKSGKILKGIYSGEIIQLGNDVHVLSVVRDITGRKQTEEALRESEERLSLVLEGSQLGYWDWNIETGLVQRNARWAEMLGYTLPEIESSVKQWTDLHHPDDKAMAWKSIQDHLEGRTQIHKVEYRMLAKDGQYRWILDCARVVKRDVQGRPLRMSGTHTDITERKQAEEALQQSERLLREIATNYPHSFLSIINQDLTVGFSAGQEFTKQNLNPESFVGLALEQVFGEHAPLVRENYLKTFDGTEMEFELFINNQHQLYRTVPLANQDGKIGRILAVVENITERKLSEEKILHLQAELREQAIRDPLTGLYNRRYLNETLERELAQAERENHPISFVMIDIDRFKDINDQYGHATGDAVLRNLAKQIMGQTRVGDIVCRYGGEEILSILPGVTAEIAFQITDRWRLSFMGSTLPLEFNRVKATISCGISEFPAHGNNRDELIALADKAMYQAKARGRNRVVIWRAENEE